MTRSKRTSAEGAPAEATDPTGATAAPAAPRARRRPRHASPSLLAPSRSLLAVGTLVVLTALGIAGCAAVADSPTVSSRAQAGGPSVPHLALDRAVAAQEAFRAADIGAGVSGTWFTSGGGGAAGPTRAATPKAAAVPTDPTAPSALAGSGIPNTALAAYKLAATREATRRPACGIVWPLLAGIGRVESDHGRFAGAVLHTDGYSTPRIVGIPLNGHGTALIRDTDRGRLDGDTVYDRAVGPMQFIPSTWAGWGVDANHDGKADPNNLFDAAAAAADYLCAAGRNLRTYAGQVQAVRSYNNSDAYIAMVLGLERAYASGVVGVTIPVLPTSPDPGTVRPPHPVTLPPVDPGKPRGVPATPKPKPKPTTSAPSTPSAAGSSSAPEGGTSSDPTNGNPSTGTTSTDPTSPSSSTDVASNGPPSSSDTSANTTTTSSTTSSTTTTSSSSSASSVATDAPAAVDAGTASTAATAAPTGG